MSTAKKVIDIALSYVGATTGSKKHKELVKIFNSVKPHGEVANNVCPWCAIAWSAWQIQAGNTSKVVPLSYNCGTLVNDAIKLGEWIENENCKPEKGWGIIYDWDDGSNYAKYDNKGAPDHVGLIYDVDKKYIYVVEGNKGVDEICGKRAVPINGRYIRGFIKPKYEAESGSCTPTPTPAPEKPKTKTITYTVKRGDTLSEIAEKYGTTYQQIAKDNGIENPNYIRVGQKLKIIVNA